MTVPADQVAHARIDQVEHDVRQLQAEARTGSQELAALRAQVTLLVAVLRQALIVGLLIFAFVGVTQTVAIVGLAGVNLYAKGPGGIDVGTGSPP